MERSDGAERTLEWSIVHWRSVVLVGVSVAAGLALTSMVIGTTPTDGGQVAAAPEAVVVDSTVGEPSTTVTVDPSVVDSIPGPTDGVTTPAPAAPAPSPLTVQPAAAPAPAPPAPAVPARAAPAPAVAAPAITPSPVQPPAAAAPAAPAPAVTPAPAAPAPAPTSAAVAPTAAPTTAAPTTAAPTTAAPATTTPRAVSLTYPSYTVSGASGVVLQFDGSSIAVASVSPQPNWVYEIESNGPRSIEIKFFNVATGNDREFHATVENGRIKVET